MTTFIKLHFQKAIYVSIGALLMWAFALGGIWKEHGNLMSDVKELKMRDEIVKDKQNQLVLSDSLLSIRLNDVVKSQNAIVTEQRRSNKVLYRIANKLHVEIPAE